MEIKPIQLSDELRMLQGVDSITPTPKAQQGVGGREFSEFFSEKLEELNQLGLESDRAIVRAIKGEEPNPHSTLLALQKAEISFQLMSSIKMKLEQAFRQLMQTPIG